MAPQRLTTLTLILLLVVGSFFGDVQSIDGEMPQTDADAPPALPSDNVDGDDAIGNADDGAASPNAAPSPQGADIPEVGDVGLGGEEAKGGEEKGSGDETSSEPAEAKKSGASIVGINGGASIIVAVSGAFAFAGFFGI